jgi:glycosyltransferase involved in cell wall biosynthesis
MPRGTDGRRVPVRSPAVIPVSVVIPAWRCAGYVEAAVRSVQAQSAAPLELIVVDDASGDGTAEAARALGATVIEHAANEGVGRTRNDGIEAASGEWIALLDCDDEWLPDHLETLWAARAGHVLVSAAAVTHGDGQPARALGWAGRKPLVLDSPAKAIVPEPSIRTSGVMFRRDDALAVGGFRPEQRRAQDLDLWLRLLERGTGVALPVVTSRYRVHPGQASADRPTGWEAQREILASYADRDWCTPAVVAMREGALAWDERRFAPSRAAAIATVARVASHPTRARGMAALLLGRRAQRRLLTRIAKGVRPPY